MAANIGHDGSVTGAFGEVALINTWRARAIRTPVEVTGFGDTALRRNRLGNTAIEGSCTGTPSATSPEGDTTDADGAAVELLISSGRKWAFTACITVVGLESDKNGKAVSTYEFVNGDSNTFTETWS